MLTLTPNGDAVVPTVNLIEDEVAADLAGGPDRGFRRIALERDDPAFVRTNLNLEKVPDTCLVTAVGAEVADHRLEAIEKLGGALATGVGILALPGTPPALPPPQPAEINLLKELDDATIGRGGGVIRLAGKAGGDWTLRVHALPADAIERAQMPVAIPMRGLYYAACRAAQLEGAPGAPPLLRLAVSDPRYVQFVAFPKKGKVTFHAQCGVSTTSEADDGTTSSAALANAVAEQLKALRTAITSKE